MSKNEAAAELETYPGGITELEGSVPIFLKITYVVFVVFGLAYFALYVAGDGSPLVQKLNQATGHQVTGHGVP